MKSKQFLPILLLMASSFLAPSAQARVSVLGDVAGPNGPDGVVRVDDTIRLLRTVLGMNLIFREELVYSDVAPLNADGTRGDGLLDIRDAVTTLRWAVGLETAPAPSSRYYEGAASLSFPHTNTHMVRQLAFRLRWVEQEGKPLEARAIIYPGRCIGYSFPGDKPVRLRGVANGNNQVILEGGYNPVHPQVRNGEWIQIRLIIDLSRDVEGGVGHRVLTGATYEEEVIGLTPEPIKHRGLFIPIAEHNDPEPLHQLRDPIFPKNQSLFNEPRTTNYRQKSDESIAGVNKILNTYMQTVKASKNDPQLKFFLNTSTSGLYDAVDSMSTLTYGINQEATYRADPAAGGMGDSYAVFQRASSHALVQALPILRSVDFGKVTDPNVSGSLDATYKNMLRLGFLFAAQKSLAAERDFRGATDAALFGAPFTADQEDQIMARAINSYEEAFYGIVNSLATGPSSRMGEIQSTLDASEQEMGLPVLQVKGRDYRLLVRILAGLSEARVEHARRALAVQDWDRAQFQCEMMTFDLRWATALMDHQQGLSNTQTIHVKNSQELIRSFNNVTVLSDLYGSAQLQVAPVGTLLQRGSPDDVGAKTVGEYDYPELTETGDTALNFDPANSLGNLVQKKIAEIHGNADTNGTLTYLYDQEQKLQAKIGGVDALSRMVIDRRREDDGALEGDLAKIVGRRADGKLALVGDGETPSVRNDLSYAVLQAWAGETPDNTWVQPFFSDSASLAAAYRDAYRIKGRLNTSIDRLKNLEARLGLIKGRMAAEDAALKQLLDAQIRAADYMATRANETQSEILRIMQGSPIAFEDSNHYRPLFWGKLGAEVAKAVVGAGVKGAVSIGISKLGLSPDKGPLCYIKNAVPSVVGGAVGGAVKGAIIPSPHSIAIGAIAGATGGLVSSSIKTFMDGSCKGKDPKLDDKTGSPAPPKSEQLFDDSASPKTNMPTKGGGIVGNILEMAKRGLTPERGPVKLPQYLDERTFKIEQNTYQINQKMDTLVNLTTGTNMRLDRIDNNLVIMKDQLGNISDQLIFVDNKLGAIQQVATSSYELQKEQYRTQVDQVKILGKSLEELDQIKNIGAVGAIANVRMAADAQRLQASIGALMADYDMQQRQTDLALEMLSIQGELIAAANDVDQATTDLDAKVAEMTELIHRAKNLSARLSFAQANVNPPTQALLNQFAVNEEYRRYRDNFDALRYKVWKLARLIEYFRNEDFPAYTGDIGLPSGGSSFNYALIFRARNARDLEKALNLLQAETSSQKVPSLEAGADRLISVKRHIMPSQEGFNADSDFKAFLQSYRGKSITFSTGIMGAMSIEGNNDLIEMPNLRDASPDTYHHLLWAVQMIYKGTAQLSGMQATLRQKGTTQLRTKESFPSGTLKDENGLPMDYYRTIHLPEMPATLPITRPEGYIRDSNRRANGKFKNRPLVASWELTLPNLSETQISGIDDLYLIYEVNQRTK